MDDEIQRRHEESERRLKEFQRQIEASQREIEASQREIEASQRQIEECQQKLAQSEEARRRTTLPEYLHSAHENLQQRIRVNFNVSETTTGNTSPIGRLCPLRIEKWEEFPLEQIKIWNTLLDVLPELEGDQCFDTHDQMKYLGGLVGRNVIGSEHDLAFITRLAIQTPVLSILERIIKDPKAASDFNLEGRIAFENHGNSIAESEDMITRAEQMSSETPHHQQPSTTNHGGKGFARGRPGYTKGDQIYIYEKNGAKVPGFIMEYKTPYKLTLDIISRGLCDMDPLEDIVHRLREEDEPARAKLLIAAAITQTFDHMVTSGLVYGCVCTGQAFIFLHIDEDHPLVVKYFLSVPIQELTDGTLWEPDSESPNRLHETALARVAVFCLQAMRQKRLNQVWISATKKDLKKWKASDIELLAQIPPTLPKVNEEHSAFKPRYRLKAEEIQGSPRISRRLRSRKGAAKSYKDVQAIKDDARRDDDEDDNDNGSGSRYYGNSPACQSNAIHGTPTPAPESRTSSRTTGRRKQTGQQRSYCTQKCLLGLSQQLPLDDMCPNIEQHRMHDPLRQSLTSSSFLGNLRAQLATSLDDDVYNLGIVGSRSALFKITLSSHGYTLMGKGTTFLWISDLLHEEAVYQYVHHLQGEDIPVHLGSVGLDPPYYYTAFDTLVHMSFLAYGGEPLYKLRGSNLPLVAERVLVQAPQTISLIHHHGIAQRDIALRNMLWNDEMQHFMCIDFERSIVFGPEESNSNDANGDATNPRSEEQRRPLQGISPIETKSPKGKRGTPEHGKGVVVDLAEQGASENEEPKGGLKETVPQKWKVVLKCKYDTSVVLDCERLFAQEDRTAASEVAHWAQQSKKCLVTEG